MRRWISSMLFPNMNLKYHTDNIPGSSSWEAKRLGHSAFSIPTLRQSMPKFGWSVRRIPRSDRSFQLVVLSWQRHRAECTTLQQRQLCKRTQDNSSVEISWLTCGIQIQRSELGRCLKALWKKPSLCPDAAFCKEYDVDQIGCAIERNWHGMAAAPMMAKELSTGNDIQAPTKWKYSTGKSGKPQLRENFNEMAFFFPTLLTDKQGGLSMQFTMPESNTTWKLQALAHTKRTQTRHAYGTDHYKQTVDGCSFSASFLKTGR